VYEREYERVYERVYARVYERVYDRNVYCTCAAVIPAASGSPIIRGSTAKSPAISVAGLVGQVSREVGSLHWYVSSAWLGHMSVFCVALSVWGNRCLNASTTPIMMGRYFFMSAMF
jgi:hypothetical protein